MKQIISILFLAIIFLYISCSVDSNDPFLSKEIIKKSPQTFNLKEKDSIVGEEGTIIIIDKNSLEFENGQSVNGNVELVLYEYYSKSDILISNLSTTSNGNLIETGGMIKILAYCENQKLKIKKDKSITLKFPYTDFKDSMEIFYGEISSGLMNWNKKNTFELNPSRSVLQYDPNDQQFIYDSITSFFDNENYYILKSSKLGWINCDRFLQIENKTTIYVSCDSTNKPIIALVFKDINAIMNGYYTEGAYFFKNVPLGYDITVVGINKIKNKYFYDEKEITVKTDMKIDLQLNEFDKKEFEQKIENLN